MNASIAERIQEALLQENLNAWLPAGEPTKLVHSIEAEMLDALPGKKKVDLPWQQLHAHMAKILAGFRRNCRDGSADPNTPYPNLLALTHTEAY
jgi:hypothetical protein